MPPTAPVELREPSGRKRALPQHFQDTEQSSKPLYSYFSLIYFNILENIWRLPIFQRYYKTPGSDSPRIIVYLCNGKLSAG